MRRIAFVVLLFLLAACTAETAVDPVLEPTVTAVPPTAAAAMETIEPTAVTSTSLSTSPTNPPEPTAEPAPAEPTQPPPTEPSPIAAVGDEPEIVVEYGRTEEGAYFKGAADAPVTLIDYSDFL